ncbi:MAG: DUF4124 domain-containing protein [Luteibacter sp.]
MRVRHIALLALLLSATSTARAETVYKCLAGGQTIYQQTPCAKTQRQETIQLQDPAPASGQATATPVPPVSPVAVDTPPPPPAPAAPPPVMYGCVRATDGKPYTSANGHPEPYLAPFGVLGAVSGPLTGAYAGPNAAAASAPELNRGKGNVAGIVHNNYVWVQDQCRALSPAESCRVLQDDADANQKAIRGAFKSDRAPLDANDARLRDQLRGCR